MQLTAEVSGRLGKAKSCQGLLYAPLERELTYRKTQRYEFDYTGSEDVLTDFIRKVLVDDVCQEVAFHGKPLFEDHRFHLDYGMKPSALDLEKETILNYHREVSDDSMTIQSLRIFTRLYIFARSGSDASPEPFIKDVVNPAIHVWTVSDVQSCA